MRWRCGSATVSGPLCLSPEKVSFDLGEVFQVRECQAGLRLLHYGLPRVVVRLVAGRGSWALAGGQRQGSGGEPGQGEEETVGAVVGIHDGSPVTWDRRELFAGAGR